MEDDGLMSFWEAIGIMWDRAERWGELHSESHDYDDCEGYDPKTNECDEVRELWAADSVINQEREAQRQTSLLRDARR